MLVKSVGRSTARASTIFTSRCAYSTPSSSRPITYEEAKEKIKMGNQFGVLGLKSGVDIRKLWPTVEVSFLSACQLINQFRRSKKSIKCVYIDQLERPHKLLKPLSANRFRIQLSGLFYSLFYFSNASIFSEKQIEEKLKE